MTQTLSHLPGRLATFFSARSAARVAAGVALCSALLAASSGFAAESIRILTLDQGKNPRVTSDDQMVATRLHWDHGGVQMYIYSPQATVGMDTMTILPRNSNPSGITDGAIIDALGNTLTAWNDVGAGFDFNSGIVPTRAGIPPSLTQFYDGAALDGYSIISFQDPGISFGTGETTILGLTSLFYFQVDTDLSDLSNLPSFAIGSTLPDGSGAVVQIDINQDNIFD
ncbi:MAG TPA: hypothetical protein VHS06_03495, partial [Chloroflexota bacterium]|nr:hypothetical protein [Chloroflexota bacterium]